MQRLSGLFCWDLFTQQKGPLCHLLGMRPGSVSPRENIHKEMTGMKMVRITKVFISAEYSFIRGLPPDCRMHGYTRSSWYNTLIISRPRTLAVYDIASILYLLRSERVSPILFTLNDHPVLKLPFVLSIQVFQQDLLVFFPSLVFRDIVPPASHSTR